MSFLPAVDTAEGHFQIIFRSLLKTLVTLAITSSISHQVTCSLLAGWRVPVALTTYPIQVDYTALKAVSSHHKKRKAPGGAINGYSLEAKWFMASFTSSIASGFTTLKNFGMIS